MSKYNLEIGDWMEFPLRVKLRIWSIEKKKSGDNIVNRGMFDDAFFLHELKPIPITTEILEKNGFTGDVYSCLEVGDGKWLEYYHHEHRLRMWWKGIDEWENHSKTQELLFQCDVTYVHELQHALRLCNIDNEIEL